MISETWRPPPRPLVPPLGPESSGASGASIRYSFSPLNGLHPKMLMLASASMTPFHRPMRNSIIGRRMASNSVTTGRSTAPISSIALAKASVSINSDKKTSRQLPDLIAFTTSKSVPAAFATAFVNVSSGGCSPSMIFCHVVFWFSAISSASSCCLMA